MKKTLVGLLAITLLFMNSCNMHSSGKSLKRGKPYISAMEVLEIEELGEPEKLPRNSAVTRFKFVPGEEYRIMTTPLRVTDVLFDEDEIIESVTIGDNIRWLVNPIADRILSIKPKRANISTNMNVFTNKRAYAIRLQATSKEKDYMQMVTWNAPAKRMSQKKKVIKIKEALIRKDHYQITGDLVPWHPVYAGDDGCDTYVCFSQNSNQLPSLFFETKNGELVRVDSKFIEPFYILDGLYKRLVLKNGNEEVRIVNTMLARPGLFERFAQYIRNVNGKGDKGNESSQ